MYIYKLKKIILIRIITIILIGGLILPDVAFAQQVDLLAIWGAHERVVSQEMRADAYRQLFEERRAPVLGGKGAWDEIVEELAEKIDYSTPGSVRLTIKEIWAKYIEANEGYVEQGNRLIKSDLDEHGKVTKETIEALRKLHKKRFVFPRELEYYISSKSTHLKGCIINRSSGRWEDSFLRNLAGIFISPKRKDERLVVQGIKEIFSNAVNRIWITQNEEDSETIEGLPNLLSQEEGFGILIQPFLDFDASGTAMSNLYGHISIEAVVGDADMAVRGIHANVAQYLYKKSTRPSLEYNPSFINMPYSVRLKGKEYEASKDAESIKTLMKDYPQINGKFSPLSKEQAQEVYRVTKALEEEIGVPLDIEWGYLDNKLYIIQIRPIIGDFKKPLVKIDSKLKQEKKIASTPIALGNTTSKGITGKMVLYGRGVTKETVAAVEDELDEGYIRVQHDVASAILERETTAKVLVDPYRGSRQAHNINLITDRIASGEFSYCNGPVLKEPFIKNLIFIPHPRHANVWITEEDVTYFGDGLRGEFYLPSLRGTEETEVISISEDFPLAPSSWEGEFENVSVRPDLLKELFTGVEKTEDELVGKSVNTQGRSFRIVVFEHLNAHRDYLEFLEKDNPSIESRHLGSYSADKLHAYLDEVDYDVDCILMHLANEERIDDILELFAKVKQKNSEAVVIIETGLSRSKFSDKLRIFQTKYGEVRFNEIPYSLPEFYKDVERMIVEKREKEQQNEPEVKTPKTPVQIRDVQVLFICDDEEMLENAEEWFGEVESTNLKVCVNATEAMEYIKENQVDVVFADFNIPLMDERNEDTTYGSGNLDKVLHLAQQQAAMRNSSIQKVVFSAYIEDNHKRRLLGKYNNIQVKITTESGFFPSCLELVRERYKQMVLDYEAAMGMEGDVEAEEDAQKPEFPEKLRVLIAADLYLDDFTIEEGLGTEEYDIQYAGDYPSAYKLLKENVFDVVIFDWVMPDDYVGSGYVDDIFPGGILPEGAKDGDQLSDLFLKLLKDVPYLKLVSGADNPLPYIRKVAGKEVEERLLFWPTMSEDSIIRDLQDYRKQQLEEYERLLHPEKNIKLKVLFADNDSQLVHMGLSMLTDMLDERDYEFQSAVGASRALGMMDEEQFDVIIYDVNLPGFDERFQKKILETKYAIFTSGYDRHEAEESENMSSELLSHSTWWAKGGFIELMDMLKGFRRESVSEIEESEETTSKLKAPEKIRILVIDDDEVNVKYIPEIARDALGAEVYLTCAYTQEEAVEKMKSKEFDVIMVDIVLPDAKDRSIIDEYNTLISEASWIVVSTGYDFGVIKTRAKSIWGREISEEDVYFKPHTTASVTRTIIELRRRQLEAYEQTKDKREKEEAKTQTQAQPEFPQKLRVLYLEDDKDTLEQSCELWRGIFENDEYEFFPVNNAKSALDILESESIDLAICDSCAIDSKLGKKLEEVDNVVIVSGFNEESIASETQDFVSIDVVERATLITKTKVDFPERIIDSIEITRQKQIVEYEQVMAQQEEEKTETQERPEFPAKLKVLWADDETAWLGKKPLEEMLGEDYEIVTADNYYEALEIVKKDKFDGIIFDWRMPGCEKDVQYEFLLRIKDIPNLNVVSFEDADHMELVISNKLGAEIAQRVEYSSGTQPIHIAPTLMGWRRKQVEEYEAAKAEVHGEEKGKNDTKTTPDKLEVVIILEPGHPLWRYGKELLEYKFSPEEYNFHYFLSVSDAVTDLQGQKIDLCIIDWWGTGMRDANLMKRIYELFQGNNYGFYITSGGINSDEIALFKKNRIEAGIPDDDRISFGRELPPENMLNVIRNAREEQLEDFEAEQAKEIRTESTLAPLQQPERPEMLKMILLDDQFVDCIRPLVSHLYGALDPNEYDYMPCETVDEALEMWETGEYDGILCDVKMPDFEEKMKPKLEEMKYVILFTAWEEYETVEIVGSDIFKKSKFIRKSADSNAGDIGEALKEFRKNQLEEYERAREAFEQAASASKEPTAEPKTASDKIKVLIVDDDKGVLSSIKAEIEARWETDDYEIDYGNETSEVAELLALNAYDAIVVDLNFLKYQQDNMLDRISKNPNVLVMSGYDEKDVQDELSQLKIALEAKILVKIGLSEILEGLKEFVDGVQKSRVVEREQQVSEPVKVSDKIRVLVVDDDDTITGQMEKLFEDVFSKEEYEFKFTKYPYTAWQMLHGGKKFDIVIFDCMLPGYNQELEDELMKVKHTVLISGWTERGVEEYMSERIFKHAQHIMKKRGFVHEILDKIQELAAKVLEEREEQEPLQTDTSTPKPEYPEKLKVLVFEDDFGFRFPMESRFEDAFGDDYEVVVLDDINEALSAIDEMKPDLVITDINLPNYPEIEHILKISDIWFGLISVYTENVAIQEVDEDVWSRKKFYFDKAAPNFLQLATGEIKKSRENQVEQYEQELARWEEAIGATKEAETQPEPVRDESKTIFVLSNSGQEAHDLAEFIQEEMEEEYTPIRFIDYYFNDKGKGLPRVIAYSEEGKDLFWLTRLLKRGVPDVVIMDDSYGGQDVLAEAMKLIREKNPEVQFIFTSKEAVLPRKEWQDKDVLAVIEKPYHFERVVEVLNGTFEEKTNIAKERFTIEQAKRLNDAPCVMPSDPCQIKIWSGYAAPRFQKGMLTRIRKKSAESLYQVEFEGIKSIVDFACEKAQSKNTITILPYNKLSKAQIQRLEDSKANVIYMDFEDNIETELDTFVQLGAIVYSGIAYLNSNDIALMGLYELLTDNKPDNFITVEELRENPKLLFFKLKPAVIHNYGELKQLNEYMEEILSFA